jgi:hypothetical protein
MQRPLLATAIIAAATFFAPLAQAANQDFKIINKTSHTIENIYVSSANEDKWGKDLLGEQVLEPGESFTVTFNGYDEDECAFDIRVEDAKTFWELDKVDLCTTSELTLKLKGTKLIWSAD